MAEPVPAGAITCTLSETDLTAYDRLMSKRRAQLPGQRSWISAVYAPITLGLLLTIGALLPGGPWPAEFGPMLVVATVAYLAGLFALQYELSRSTRLGALAVFRANPLLQQPRHVTMQDDVLLTSSASMSAQYRYAAFTDVEVTRDHVAAWLGSATAVLFPVRAFANAAAADAFAEELRRRIATARAAAS
jgi:hypothetical protein